LNKKENSNNELLRNDIFKNGGSFSKNSEINESISEKLD